MAKRIDWLKIKSEYISGEISQRELARIRNVSESALTKKANKEKWQQQKVTKRNEIDMRVQQRTAEVLVEKQVDRIKRIVTVSDTLLQKLEEAAAQLDNYLVTKRVKVKTAEYDPEAKGKLKTEVTTETEDIGFMAGIIDKNGLKQLTGALKDLKEIQGTAAATDTQLEKLDEVLGKIEGEV